MNNLKIWTAANKKAKIEKKIPADLPHVFISSVAHLGLEELKEELWKALNK